MATAKRTVKKVVKPKYDRVIGIDLGNGMVKVETLNFETGEIYQLILPSAWAYKRSAGTKIHSKEVDVDTFTIDGTDYIWGNEIENVDDIKTTYGLEGRYKTDAFKIMAKIVLTKIVSDLKIAPTEKILVVTGVPSQESNISKIEEEISDAFYGENNGIHEIAINGDTKIFKVADVVVLSQAVSAVIARYLDYDGAVEDEDYRVMKVAVIDIGAGTTEFDIINRLSRNENYTSVKKGFRVVYNFIRKEIKKVYPNLDVSDYKLIKCLESKKYVPSRREEAVDFTEKMDEAIDDLVTAFQQEITSTWDSHSDIDEVLLIGASAKEFKDRIEDVISGITIPPNAETINVEGYYKYGVNLNATSGADS